METLDKSQYCKAFLTDTLKTANCLLHDPFVVKVNMCDMKSHEFVISYSINRKQKIKPSPSFSECFNLIFQFSTRIFFRSLFFSMLTFGMCYELNNVFLVSCGSDHTPYICDKVFVWCFNKVQIIANRLFGWFWDNYLKPYAFKCHLNWN